MAMSLGRDEKEHTRNLHGRRSVDKIHFLALLQRVHGGEVVVTESLTWRKGGRRRAPHSQPSVY